MPVTGTLGALTYSKITLEEENWVIHFTSNDFANLPLRFSSFDTATSLNEEIYIAGTLRVDEGFVGGFSGLGGQVFAISVLPDGVPRIQYSTQYERNQPFAISANVDSQQNTINFLPSPQSGVFTDNNLVRFSSVSGVAANVSTTQTYFLRDVFFLNAYVVRLSTSPGGPAINLTATGNLEAVMGSLIENNTSGEFNPTDIVFDSFNNRLLLSGTMLLALPSTITPITNYTGIITLDNDGNFLNSQRFLPGAGESGVLGNIRRPNTRTCSSLVTGNNEIVTSAVFSRPTNDGEVFNKIVRIDNGNVIWSKRSPDISSTNGVYSVENRELLGTTSDGNIITAINTQYPRLVGFSIAADWFLSVNKLNKVDGSTIWKTGTLAVTGGFDTTGPFAGIVIDSNDDIYLSSREDRSDFSSFNTLGSFILKLNNNGEVVWQKHYVASSTTTTQIRHLHIDSSDQIYFVATGPLTGTGPFRPSTALIIGQLDIDGNEIWCNRMNFSVGTSIRPTVSIKKQGTALYILAENGNNDVGMLFKIPADGSIPGTGNYSIATSSITYDISYELDSLNISNANMRLDSISTADLIDSPDFEFSNAIYDDNLAIVTQETRSLK